MPKKLFTPEQILAKLRQISGMTALGRIIWSAFRRVGTLDGPASQINFTLTP